MKSISSKSLINLVALIFSLSLLTIDNASAQPRGRGGGRNFQGGGASRRIDSGVNLQNRGNFSGSREYGNRDRSQFQQNRGDRQNNFQDNRSDRQDNFQENRGDRQDNMTERTEIRQDNRTERTDIRQDNITERQNNRQDFIDNNYYGRGWYGGGYYVPPGWGAWAATAGFVTGVVVGATVSSPPPYYSTVYVGSTTYIYSDGVYLQQSGSSYVVVEPPTGAVVTYLPEGCTQVQINNISMFNCSGIYYQPFYQSGATVYKVVQL